MIQNTSKLNEIEAAFRKLRSLPALSIKKYGHAEEIIGLLVDELRRLAAEVESLRERLHASGPG